MFCIGSSSSSSVQAEHCSAHFVQNLSLSSLAPKEGPTTFVCKSQECLWQDWYIFQDMNSLSTAQLSLVVSVRLSVHLYVRSSALSGLCITYILVKVLVRYKVSYLFRECKWTDSQTMFPKRHKSHKNPEESRWVDRCYTKSITYMLYDQETGTHFHLYMLQV